jgi:pyruvate,water dikinase
MTMLYTKTFSDVSRSDVASAGGKAAFLGELTRHGIPVPAGFVVLTEAYNDFINASGLSGRIDATLSALRRGELSEASMSDEITRAILSQAVPPDMEAEIMAQHASLGAQLVAVRSSATAEDNAEHSWAGQLESYLNVTAGVLPERLKQCWASLFSPRAIAYRLSEADGIDSISVAVVVQEMVNPEVAGIAFSVDPVTEDRGDMIIEAVFGLGESIVQGHITPDHYRVHKESFHVADAFLSPQERGIYRLVDGSTGWKTLDPAKVSQRKMTESETARLAGLIVDIEKIAGFPCDVEWVYKGGQFSIVQCRPITTLS